MSLSLSNPLRFALIPLVKTRKKAKISIFFILEVQFHHEGGLSESRYLELFFSAWSIFSPWKKSASAEAPFNLFWTLALILDKLVFKKCRVETVRVKGRAFYAPPVSIYLVQI